MVEPCTHYMVTEWLPRGCRYYFATIYKGLPLENTLLQARSESQLVVMLHTLLDSVSCSYKCSVRNTPPEALKHYWEWQRALSTTQLFFWAHTR